MNVLSWILNESFANRLTLTLLHFLWQGCCVGLCSLFVCSILSKGSARFRYALHVGAMLAMAMCLPVTFLLIGEGSLTVHREIVSRRGFPSQNFGAEVALNPPGGTATEIAIEAPEPPFQRPAESQSNGGHANSVTHVEITPRERTLAPSNNFAWVSNLVSTTSPWIAVLYILGVALFLGRLFMGIWGGYRLRKMSNAIRDKEILPSFGALARRLGIQVAPAIAWCDRISIPVVVGVLRPMILLPTGAESDLSSSQLSAILLHELAHIRRLDPLVNLLQRIVEAVLFFHPVVWVISRRITIERELAADDMVLAAGWERPQYADALVRMAELAARVSRRDISRRVALIAASGDRPSELKIRILRLLGNSPPPQLNLSRGIISLLVLLVTGSAVLAWSHNRLPPTAKDLPNAPYSEPIDQEAQVTGAAENLLEQGRKANDEEIEQQVLTVLRTPYEPDPRRGSWQRGAYEAQVLSSLSLAPRQDLVVKTLIKAITGGEKVSDFERRLALIYLGNAAPEQIVPLLIIELEETMLDAENKLRLQHDIAVLEGMGEAANKAAPVLITLLDSADAEIRNAALVALVKVAPSSSEAMNAIASRVGKPEEEVWSRAVYEVGRYGELAKPLGPTFITLLDSQSMEVRDYAAWALVKSEYDEGKGIDYLLKQATSGSPERRAHAATFLAALGNQAKSVLPQLRALVDDSDAAVAREIQSAIERIEKDDRICSHAEEAAKTMESRREAAKAIQQLRGGQDDEDRAAELDKEPYDAYIKIMDFAPMSECKAALKRLDDGGVTKLAAQSRERLARRWKSISETPVEPFLREIPKTDAGDDVERGGGDRIGVQTELDGVWSHGKGNADTWRDWIVRKQEDYRTGRLQLLFEAAERYRKIGDFARAKRALIAGLSGYEIYDTDLNTLIRKYWPITSDAPAKSLGSAPHAWTLANFLTELSSAQQSLGEIDDAIITHSRLTLVHFMLSWNLPSAGPTRHARELWALIRKKPEFRPPLFWFHVMDEKNATHKFDLTKFGQKNEPITYHHQNVTAAPSLDFAELKITAKTRGRKGLLDVNRINQEGKHESIGTLRPAAEGATEQTITETLKVPASTGLIQFLVAGDDFQVGDVTVEATFTKRSEGGVQSTRQGQVMISASGARILQKPSVLLPDHWILSAVGFDDDDKELVTASTQSFATIRRWDLIGLRLLSEVKLQADQHGRPLRPDTMKLSGDRKRVVAATDEYVGIWDTGSGELLKKLPFPTKSGIYDCCICTLDCTPDLSVIAGNWSMPGRLTLSYDAHVMIWNGNSGELLRTLVDKGATDLKSIDLSSDGTRLAATNGSGATVWDTSSGKQLLHVRNDNTGRKHSDPEVISEALQQVWSVQLSPDGRQLAIGDVLGVKLTDVASGKITRVLEGPYRYSDRGSPPLVFSKDGLRLARLGTQGERRDDKADYVVPIWSTETGKKLFELQSSANDLAFSADGKRVAIGFSDMQQALAIWTLDEDEDVEEPKTTVGPGPDSRVDKIEENGHYHGKVAAEYAERFKPAWNKASHGLEYGIAFTKPKREYRIGERVPLVVFFRNVGDKPVKFDTQPDFYGNAPKVIDEKGAVIAMEKIPLLGQIPHYHETLEPSEVLGPFYLSFGLGENPRPGKQHWHPFVKSPLAGKYSLAHTVRVNVSGPERNSASTPAALTTSSLECEIVE